MKRNNKKITTQFILFGLIIIGVVYAILQANLQINGVAKIKSNSWDVHFDNIQINSESISIGDGDSAAVIDPNNNCKIDFEVTLSLPGDFYEFTVDVVNAGTIDAMIGTLNKTLKVNNEIVSEVPDYLRYDVTYEDGAEILNNHKLAKNSTETYKVRVEYKSDIDELPEATTVVTTLEPQYIQADNTAIPIMHTQPKVPVTDTIYWALQDNNSDGDYEKLVISDHEVTGSDSYQGSFVGTTEFTSFRQVPWNLSSEYGGIANRVEEIKIEGVVAPTSTAYWFGGTGAYSQTLEGNLNDLNVSNVTNMKEMFHFTGWQSKTVNLGDLSRWNTSKVTNMNSLFYSSGMTAKTWNIGDIGSWDTSNVTDMTQTFSGAGMENTIWSIGDLSEWNTSKVTTMESMFSQAGQYGSSIFDLGDLSGWDTSQVTNMYSMFFGTGQNATTWNVGNISGWNTSKVTNMWGMFRYAGKNATTFKLDFSGWNTSNVTSTGYMFDECGQNATTFELNLSGWNTSKVTFMTQMFSNAGTNATTWSIKISSTNGGGINNTTTRLYGSNTSKYANPDSGRQFTLA